MSNINNIHPKNYNNLYVQQSAAGTPYAQFYAQENSIMLERYNLSVAERLSRCERKVRKVMDEEGLGTRIDVKA